MVPFLVGSLVMVSSSFRSRVVCRLDQSGVSFGWSLLPGGLCLSAGGCGLSLRDALVVPVAEGGEHVGGGHFTRGVLRDVVRLQIGHLGASLTVPPYCGALVVVAFEHGASDVGGDVLGAVGFPCHVLASRWVVGRRDRPEASVVTRRPFPPIGAGVCVGEGPT